MPHGDLFRPTSIILSSFLFGAEFTLALSLEELGDYMESNRPNPIGHMQSKHPAHCFIFQILLPSKIQFSIHLHPTAYYSS